MPSLVNAYSINSGFDSSALTTSAFTPTVGDVIVVKFANENPGTTPSAPTDTQGNTYTLWGVDASASHCRVNLWAAVAASATSMTVTANNAGTNYHSATIEQWTSAALDASPAVNATETGTGAPSATLTTTQPLSVVSWLCADYAANNPTGHVYSTVSAVPTQDGLHDVSGTGNYVAYYAWQNAASAGSQTFGLTSPTGQTWSMLGIEILNVAGGGTPPDQDQAQPLIVWQ